MCGTHYGTVPPPASFYPTTAEQSYFRSRLFLSLSSTVLAESRRTIDGLMLEEASLELLQNRALQRRVDTKFILRREHLGALLSPLTDAYALVRAGGHSVAQYNTLYFDTDTFDLVRQHHRGRRPRFKVRIRHYLERDLTYLEVKNKLNANTTLKSRRPLAYEAETLFEDDLAFVDSVSPLDSKTLQPTLRTDFGRITLVGRDTMERATFDVHLRLHSEKDSFTLPNLVIAEVKQDRFRARSPLMLRLRELARGPQSISKYCTAAALIHPELPLNRFRPILRAIRKTSHGPTP